MDKDYEYPVDQCDVTDKAALRTLREKRCLWLSWINTDEHHAIWTVLSSMVWSDVSFRTIMSVAIATRHQSTP